ncbi:hypothetical protein ACLKA6_006214 [Drosophila palustris]
MQTRNFELKQRSCRAAGASVTVTLLLALALLRIDVAVGRPDVRQSPFALDLQPPLLEAATDEAFTKSKDRTVDSYGNPIDALRPIDTPDGRKVVSAQGVQFEIPNYASGITEIRQPADDLLPPHIAPPTQPPQPPNTNSLSFATTPTRTHNHIHSPVEPLTTTTTPAPAPAPVSLSNHFKRDSRSQQFVITAAGPKHAPPTFTLLTLNPQPPQSQLAPPASPAPPESSSKRIDSIDATTYSNATPTPSQLLVDAIAVAQSTTSDTDTDTDSTSFAPAPQPATSLTPPKHESSTSTTSTEVEVEQAQLQEHQEQREESAHAPQLASGTLPDYLLELQRQDPLIDGPVPWIPAPHGTPLSVIAWDLLPPLETEPQTEPLIITEQQPTKHVVGVEQPGNHNIRITLGSGQGLSPVAPTVGHVTSGQVAVVPLERDGPEAHGTNAHVGGGSTTTPRNNNGRFPSRHRGTVHYSTTTSTQRPRSSTTSTTSTTTTTRPPLTTRTTVPTTTTRTNTPRTTSTTTPSTTTVRSTTPLDPSTFYKLDNEEEYAYTLPPWLQEVTDPDLDVAVTFIVPTDNDQYNHTLNEDLEPPFEPFVDLHNIQLTPPPTARPTTTSTTSTTSTTTTTTTTTRRPSSTTSTTKAPIFKAQQQQQPLKPLQPQLITTTTHTAPAAHHPGSTTTTATPFVDPNPFDSATLPPWLQDFDYPDVGPGVPYNPDNFKDESPGGSASGGSKPNDFQPQGFGSRHINSQSTTTTTTTTTLNPITTITTSSPATITASSASASASAFPSKVTLPLPAINNGAAPELSTEEPPLVLIPPVDESAAPLGSSSSFDSSLPPPAFSLDPNPNSNPTTNSISHFAAPFDSPSSTIAGQASTSSSTEQFPLSATDNQKVEYTKSDEGKVISTPVNTLRKDSQPSVAPQTPTRSPVSNTGKYTGGFGGPAGLLRPQQSVAKPDIYVAGNDQEFSHTVKANRQRPGAAPAANTGRYTGGFGAPSGVLSPQNAPRPFQQSQSQPQPQESRAHPSQVAGAASSHHQSRFGGPPGILVPFDNVQRTAQQ